MPQTPNAATRFTSTGPHASTKSSTSVPGSKGSRIDFGVAPPNESPQQKIARLRAAANRAKIAKEDRFDGIVRVGRRWADRMHRVTAYSLLGLTVVSVLVASAGITDLVIHNRRRRKEWYNEQELKRRIAIDQAAKALEAGVITEDQLLLLGQERAKLDAAEARKNAPGVFKRASSYVFGGLAKEEQAGGRLGAAAATASEKAKEATKAAKRQLLVVKDAVAEQLDSSAAESVMNVPKPRATPARAGGLLDQQAQNLVDATVQTGNSWRRWLTRS